jgi:diguanylate cyclase (GGDEF)-like protein
MGESFVILVVDATHADDRPWSALLGPEGYRVMTARDAPHALELAALHRIDLFAVAPSRPDEARELLTTVRNAEPHRHVPLIVLLDQPERERRLRLLRLGADEVFEAPFDDEAILARVARLIAVKRQHDSVLAERDQLAQLSITDGLTQVQNHRFFQERLREEFRRAQRYDDPLALILIDLDHFKTVNDRYGHPVGDQVLREVAQCLKHAVRETDLLARYGGEEFAVLLPKTHLAGSLTVAERIWADLGKLEVGPERQLRITASLGVSSFPGRSVLNPEQLVRTADDALYRAKREGRNKICLFQHGGFPVPAAAKAG